MLVHDIQTYTNDSRYTMYQGCDMAWYVVRQPLTGGSLLMWQPLAPKNLYTNTHTQSERDQEVLVPKYEPQKISTLYWRCCFHEIVWNPNFLSPFEDFISLVGSVGSTCRSKARGWSRVWVKEVMEVRNNKKTGGINEWMRHYRWRFVLRDTTLRKCHSILIFFVCFCDLLFLSPSLSLSSG